MTALIYLLMKKRWICLFYLLSAGLSPQILLAQRGFDPQVKETKILNDLDYLETRSSSENQKGITVSEDVYETCKGAHAIAILTEWDEFKTYDWQKIYQNMQKPAFVFDGRNLLDGEELKKIGFVFQAIGTGK